MSGKAERGAAPVRLFVYGTLRSGRAPASLAWLERLPRRPARVAGALLDLGAYPGFVPGASSGERVVGELLEVAAARLPALDRYEGHDPEDPAGSLFVREPAEAEVAGGERVACVLYRYAGDPEGHARVPAGDWAGRRRKGG